MQKDDSQEGADQKQPLQQLLSQPPPLLRRLQLGVEVQPDFRMPAVDMSAATQLEHFSTSQLLPPGVVFPVGSASVPSAC
ncbi:hypothetical protein OEZ86_007056 [Tetradesmus obliquus]|nr:hypothetical protein OEZ86_007056 [Tetradesmus obliquus]